jgi:hypothetical protein
MNKEEKEKWKIKEIRMKKIKKECKGRDVE